MRKVQFGALSGLLFTVALGGCAGDGSGLLITASTPEQTAEKAADPRCVTLLSQIEALRADGTVDRVEQAAEGSTRSVMVKREALSRVAQLNKANEEYRASCSQSALKKADDAKPAASTTGTAAQPQAAAQPQTSSAPATSASATPAQSSTSEALTAALIAND